MDQAYIEQIQIELSDEIVRCYNCQPYEKGSPIWLGPSLDINDLLWHYELADKDFDEILSDFSCPNCGTELSSKYDEVEIKTEYDRKVEAVFQDIHHDETIGKLERFNNYLSKFPYLGLSDPDNLGRDLFESIKNGAKHKIKNEIWFRARLLNDESRLFEKNEMGSPDPNKVFIREGRFNHTGQSFLYLSDDEETAFDEIIASKENIGVIQKYRLKDIRNLLDLRKDYSNVDPESNIIFLAVIYNGFVTKSPDKISSWNPEYFVSRFIADSARYFNYDGIIYSSAVSSGNNIVLFAPNKFNIPTSGNPKPFVKKIKKGGNLTIG